MLDLAQLKTSKMEQISGSFKEICEALILEKSSSLFSFQPNLYRIFTRAKKICDCFSCLRRHLADEGRFLIELFNSSVKTLAREPDYRYPVGQYEDPKAGSQVFVTEEVMYDASSQVNHIQWFFRNEGSNDEVKRSFKMRHFFPNEIDALL